MWVNAYDGGRVNLEQTAALLVSGAASNWVVNAKCSDGNTVKLADALPSKNDAVAFVDDLLLNGS